MISAVTIKDLVGMDIRGYHLNRLIGAGSYGAVYESSSGSEKIAIKASIKASDVLNEANALQRLYYREFTPKYYFRYTKWNSSYYWSRVVRPRFGVFAPESSMASNQTPNSRENRLASSRLEAVHGFKLVHTDIKLGNFAVSIPTPHNGDLVDRVTNPNFSVMKYCSFEVGMGIEPMPKDDIHQLSFAILYASGFDFPRKLRCPPEERLEWKRELLREPSKTLPPLARFLTPWYEAISELNDIVPIDYDALKQKIQQSLPAHNAAADLYMEMQDGVETLV
ncbi:hypothetical protein L5515_019245 [Caenorhabditis briggsae]|uniref:Protein kinase domain-containing protein n=1 Tax=Caenorhabditis briggsae TaxID=6238 RepID=A0AAE9A1J6_CAEBR|nr:hypothetical protein L3Y34_013398 [Caenorhabditis briggsae]UMM43952.1 hypothetical protein L5515_019245 [Caenorhabditis briggsae]